MAFEPINVFSHRIDPRGVAELLRKSGYEMQITGPDDDWEEIVLTVHKGGLFKKPKLMTFGHSSDYYDGDDWPRQVMGMQGYFSGFPETPNKREIMQLIRSFRFSLAVPQHDLDIDSRDERLKILYAVCEHLDAAIFTPSSLRDARGRILIGAGGNADPNAVMPKLPPTADATDDEDEEEDEDYSDPIPPTPERVARRALALTAVAARATLELDAPQLDQPDGYRQDLLRWVDQLSIGDELEPEEWKVLQRPVGRLEQQDFINAMWRVEGLAVLAWALHLHELPPDDELIVPVEVYKSMGFLVPEIARGILDSPELRPAEEINEMQIHFLMLHWRVRDYSIRPQAMDFAAFSKQCWIGSFDISKFRLIDNDLAIGNVAINDAEDDALSTVSSLAHERHLASNWLVGYSEIYSETDTST
jgi:hypothetical protein